MMAKDPAVLFYTQDFLVGSSLFTPLQKGHYITLLCYQQQSPTGSLSESEIKSLMGKDYSKQWSALKVKFKQDENGFYNERMRREINRRKQYSDKQKERVDKRWANRGNTAVDTTVLPNNGNTFLETEIEIENNKGGVGEKTEGWNWDQEKAKFLNDGKWVYKFCTDKKLTEKQFVVMANHFLSDLELKEDYKPIKEIRSHFTNWYNKVKSSGSQMLTPEPIKGQSAREIEEAENRKKLGM